ncbi:glycosyltransferase family 2 protein [Kitasatospora sp. NPDC059577]|uniref:glycosyltransferase family 2 protein n=1 Tax=Kitasatospora sp. NPDC059577 TaxID=3346873 RepID=UPI003683F095
MTVPDGTVVVAVRDAMPYLTAWLDPLVGRAPGRLEVVAVDDGSTDGGGELLDEYAARHPGLFRVVHRPGPDGPAGPVGRGAAPGRGRYVLFLGADDRLGGEALERLVAAADAWGSDVVVPGRAGADGRPVPRGSFPGGAGPVGSADPAPAWAPVWAPAGTELFRLDLVRRHGPRRDEGLTVLSDRPFTQEAFLRAGRVSVLADADCSFLVPREDRGGVTGPAGAPDRLRGIAALRQAAAELAAPGAESDAVRARSFARDVPRVLQEGFLLLDHGLQERVCVEVDRLVERFGAREVYHRLPVAARVRIELAAVVGPEALRDQIRYEAAHGEPPVVVDGRRHYAAFPAFRDARLGLPDELFLLREEPAAEAVPPRFGLARQLWRGVVPARLRRRLWRHPLRRALRGAGRRPGGA